MKYAFIICMLIFVSCKKTTKKWQLEKELLLKNVHPIGAAILDGELWLSDGDGNRLVKINKHGVVIDEILGLERPMHIDVSENILLVPEYGKDVISTYANKVRDSITGVPKMDAPASVSKYMKELAIADFYNNVIHYNNGKEWLKIGKKGTSLGALNYPTDVQITDAYIYVADAYNHRIQVFNKEGKFVKVLANNQGINAATGLLVNDGVVYVTDFENNRVLLFSPTGELIQVIDSKINKLTDVLIYDKKLYVLNYKNGSLSIFIK